MINGLTPAHINVIVVRRDTIDSDYFAVASTPQRQDELSSLYNVQGAVNVYYIPQPGEAGLATFSPNQMAWWNNFHEECARNNQYIIVESVNQMYSSLAHELGHYFDLLTGLSRFPEPSGTVTAKLDNLFDTSYAA